MLPWISFSKGVERTRRWRSGTRSAGIPALLRFGVDGVDEPFAHGVLRSCVGSRVALAVRLG